MIQKIPAFITSDKQTFATIEEARKHELTSLIKATENATIANNADAISDLLMANSDKIVDLLTTKPNSRPSARKVNRKKKVVAAQEANSEMKMS